VVNWLRAEIGDGDVVRRFVVASALHENRM